MELSGDGTNSQVRDLRTSQGVSLAALSRHCALSLRQLQQIEEGGLDAFYSPAIKQMAERKVLAALQDALAVQTMQRDNVSPVHVLPRLSPPKPSVLQSPRTQRVA